MEQAPLLPARNKNTGLWFVANNHSKELIQL